MRASIASAAPTEEGGGVLLRQLRRVSAIAILVAVAAAGVALATWSATDPSLSHASASPVHNVLGFLGASFSDFLTQMLGLAAPVALLAPAVWALRLVGGRPAAVSRWRLLAWLASPVAAAGLVSALPPPETWPLPTGLGGVAGDFLVALPIVAARALDVPEDLAILAIFGPLTGLLIAYAASRHVRKLAPRPQVSDPLVIRRTVTQEAEPYEIDDEKPGLFSTVIGTLGHWRLALASRFRRPRAEIEDDVELLGIDVPERTALPERGRRDGRQEPRFGVRAGDEPAPRAPVAAAAQAPWDEDEEESDRDWDETAADAAADFFPAEEDYDEDDGDEEPIELPPPPIARRPPTPAPRPAAPARTAPPPPAALSRRIDQPAPPPKVGKRAQREVQPSLLDTDRFELPPLTLLAEPKPQGKGPGIDAASLENNARMLEGVLEDFGVRGQIINVRPGPVVTLYELEPAPGIKSSRVIGLADDIARSMSAISARVAVIPGKNAIGIELPNVKRETVYLRQLLASADFEQTKQRLAMCLGKTIGGEPVIADLARMPHLLVAGTTGSGKSVSINTMILSVLYRLTPQQCRLIMIDPKMLELSVYDGIPHLLTPVVTDPKKAVVALKWTVREMEDRYRKMSKLGVRNIDGFNARVVEAAAKGERLTRIVQTGFDRSSGEPIFEEEEISSEPLPYIVVIVDEMADLMMVAGKEIEGAIQRLAQMARAAGIHLVMATQRPSVDVITGTIKANFPTRISFQVTSKIDSRTILGEQGAEQLLGQGDMLYMAGGGRIQRVHGPFCSDDEVEAVVAHLKTQGAPDYLDQITADDDAEFDDEDGGGVEGMEESADLYDRAVAVVLRDRKASTSYVQRRLQIGYNRAASIIERMEREGIVGPANHAGKREILVGGDDSAAA